MIPRKRSQQWRRISFVFAFPIVILTFGVLLHGCAEKIDTPLEHLEVAYRFERANKLPEAVVAYQKSLELNDQQPTAWYDLGVAYAEMDDFSQAIAAYSKAIELDPGMARAFNNRAAAYARLKQFTDAIADCDRAIELDPNDYLAWRNRGLAKHDNGDMDGAVSDYDESIRIYGRGAESYHFRGNVFLDRKQWSRALEDFEQAIRGDDTIAAAHLSKAISLARLGRAAEAELARARAKELGSNVDDVLIENLLPMEEGAEVAVNTRRSAVEFVRSEFKKNENSLETCDSPWDLRSPSGESDESEKRYAVRVLTANDDGPRVSFSTAELDQFQQSNIDTTLVILQLTEPSKPDSQVTFKVISTLEHWSPDLSQMKPLTWSLPMPLENDAAAAPSVTAAKP